MTVFEDMEAIKQLKARYFRCMDTKDWDGMSRVFVEDVVVDTTEDGGGIVRGVAAFLSALRGHIDHAVTVHQGHMPEIEITSATTARGVWAMEDEIWWPEGGPLRHLHGRGHYHDTYRKTDGGWRIESSRLTRLHRVLK